LFATLSNPIRTSQTGNTWNAGKPTRWSKRKEVIEVGWNECAFHFAAEGDVASSARGSELDQEDGDANDTTDVPCLREFFHVTSTTLSEGRN
jgi:hypothetical protein